MLFKKKKKIVESISDDLKRFIEIKSMDGIKYSEEGVGGVIEMEMKKGNAWTQVVHIENQSKISRSWFEADTYSFKHYHRHRELIYCIKGEVNLKVENKECVECFTLIEGESITLEGGISHSACFPEYTVLLITEYPI